MNKYKYAVCYYDAATKTASFKPAEVIAATERIAQDAIADAKGEQEWLTFVFDADESELDGIIIGDHVLIAQEPVAPGDRTGQAGSYDRGGATFHFAGGLVD